MPRKVTVLDVLLLHVHQVGAHTGLGIGGGVAERLSPASRGIGTGSFLGGHRRRGSCSGLWPWSDCDVSVVDVRLQIALR